MTTANSKANCIAISFLLVIAGCGFHANRLVGHTYSVEGVGAIPDLILKFAGAKVQFVSDNQMYMSVRVFDLAASKEVHTYSFDGATLIMDNQVYEVSFSGDTALISQDNLLQLKFVPVR